MPVSSCRYVFFAVMSDTVIRLRSGGLVSYMMNCWETMYMQQLYHISF